MSITLRNKGKDSYKPEVYGNTIIVDLRITREGLRTYKLKNKSGRSWRSTRLFATKTGLVLTSKILSPKATLCRPKRKSYCPSSTVLIYRY